jgi:subtilisin family serine protease
MKKLIALLSGLLLLWQAVVSQNRLNPSNTFRLAPGVTQDDYVPATIIFKVKPEYRQACSVNGIADARMQNLFQRLGATSIYKIFPNHQPPAVERNAAGQKMADLSLVYKMEISPNADLVKSINAVLATGMVEFAEPKYRYKPFFNPNDPNITLQQNFLNRIKAYQAWDIQQGDTNVVIGIVDTGTDWDHPDLVNQIKYNYNDPINGTDDDGDGYIDNYRGWDMSDNDNNPMVPGGGTAAHGSHVSGCAAAQTNNGVGVASPGFNCKFLPVKATKNSDPNSYLTEGYEGIVYAADHGCHIINCSWGGAGGGSFGQLAIDYATINKNALVVCAAGNDGNETVFYPASYKYVISVASTGSNSDAKSSFSNYGMYIDVCAPGSNIYSTFYNNTYNYSSGTSMASPVAAGAAAIIKSQFPNYTGLQVGEQLRVTCDNIYGSNSQYIDKLGKGRINMQNALIYNTPSVRYEDVQFNDNNDNAFVIGDTVNMSGIFINYLAPTTNCIATLSTTSPYVTLLNNTFNVGALATMGSTDNLNAPFQIKINNNAPLNAKIVLKITFTDGLYSDFQIFDLLVNVDYINITINDVHTTITSKGRLFWNGDSPGEGLGFNYNGNQLNYEGSLMIGSSSTKVSDMARATGGTPNNDFTSLDKVSRVVPDVFSEFDLTGRFRDNAASSPLPVTVRHNAYAWSTPGDRKYVIVEYIITNTGTSALTNLYAGIFTDWDIMDYAKNRGDEDQTLKMGYNFSTEANGLYAGVKVLTPGPFMHYAIDNITGGGGGIDITTDFTTAEKYQALSTNRAQAGTAGTGNDVCDVTGTGPFAIAAGDSIKVAFAILAGDDLQDLTNSAVNAQIKYDNLLGIDNNPAALTSIAVYPNPAVDFINAEILMPRQSIISVTLTNVLGETVYYTEKNNEAGKSVISIPCRNFTPGVYFYEIKAGQKVSSGKIIISD